MGAFRSDKSNNQYSLIFLPILPLSPLTKTVSSPPLSLPPNSNTMSSLTTFFSNFSTITIIFVVLLLHETLLLFQTLTGTRTTKNNSNHDLITTTQFLKFIEEKNPTTSYITSTSSSKCAVCLSDFEEGEKIRSLKCKHMFHKDCLDKWLQIYLATCPLCRTKVLPDQVVANFHLSGVADADTAQTFSFDGTDDDMLFLLSTLHAETETGRGVPRFF